MGEGQKEPLNHLLCSFWNVGNVFVAMVTASPLTSDPQLSVPRSVHGHQGNGLGVVAVDDLQLLPRDWSGLSLQEIQTCTSSERTCGVSRRR